MKLFAVLLGALALVAGFTGGMRAYSTPAGPPVPAAHIAARHYPPAQVVRPGPVVKWAPCVKPAVRVGRACVTHVTRTVTLPAPTVTGPAAAQAAASPTVRVQHARAASPRHASSGGHHDDGGGGHDD